MSKFKAPETIEEINNIMRNGTPLQRHALKKWFKNHAILPYMGQDPRDVEDLKSMSAIRGVLENTFKGDTFSLFRRGHEYKLKVIDIDDKGPMIPVQQAITGFKKKSARVPRGMGDRHATMRDLHLRVIGPKIRGPRHPSKSYDVTYDAATWLKGHAKEPKK